MKRISWMPSWVKSDWTYVSKVSPLEDPLYGVSSNVTTWDCVQPNALGWSSLAIGLKRAGEVLKSMPIRRIVEAIGTATEPYRRRNSVERRDVVEAIREANGLSEETIHRSLDIEMNNYRTTELWATLRRELRDPFVLDEFRSDNELGGLTRAIGPTLVVAIATGNVPGLALLPVARALLVKSPVLLKVARGEPTFAARFLRTLGEVDEKVAEAVVVTYWGAKDVDAFDGALRDADCIILFGGIRAVQAIRQYVRPEQRIVVHGHRFSGGVITRAHLEQTGYKRVAELLAQDVSSFDQHACIAPKVLIVEGDDASVDAFGDVLAVELARYAEACPPGLLSAYDASSLAARRLSAFWDEAVGIGRSWMGANLTFTVTRSQQLPPATVGGDRYIVLVPAPNLDACVERLAERAEYLQNVVVGAAEHEFPVLAERLARLGACRVSPPGRGANPTMIWRHDGRACVSDLVRWCDVEGFRVAVESWT